MLDAMVGSAQSQNINLFIKGNRRAHREDSIVMPTSLAVGFIAHWVGRSGSESPNILDDQGSISTEFWTSTLSVIDDVWFS